MQGVIRTGSGASDQSLPKEESKAAPYPWILHPVLDILFCCGGLFWLLLIPLFAGVKLEGGQAIILFVLLNVLFTDTHQPSTLFRVYGIAHTRKQLGIPVGIAALVVIALCGAALYSQTMTMLLVRLTLAWSWQHLLAQVYGVALIYCYKRQYIMTNREKQTLFVLVQSAIWFALIRMFSIPPAGGVFPVVGYSLPYWGPLPQWMFVAACVVFQCAVAAFAFMVVRKWIKERQLFPLPALLTVLTGLGVTVLLSILSKGNLVLLPFIGIFVQNCFHSCQYNVVTTAYFLKEKGLPEGVPFSKIATQLLTKRTLNYYAFLLILGLCLSVALPAAFSVAGFQTATIVGYCMLNLHHYYSDGVIWKLRDPVVRKLLVA